MVAAARVATSLSAARSVSATNAGSSWDLFEIGSGTGLRRRFRRSPHLDPFADLARMGSRGNPHDRGRYRDRWQEQNWVLALRRLIFHDPGNRRLSCECPVRRKHGAVLGAIKTKPLRGGLKARLDSPCAQRPSVRRPGRRNGHSNRTKKLLSRARL